MERTFDELETLLLREVGLILAADVVISITGDNALRLSMALNRWSEKDRIAFLVALSTAFAERNEEHLRRMFGEEAENMARKCNLILHVCESTYTTRLSGSSATIGLENLKHFQREVFWIEGQHIRVQQYTNALIANGWGKCDPRNGNYFIRADALQPTDCRL